MPSRQAVAAIILVLGGSATAAVPAPSVLPARTVSAPAPPVSAHPRALAIEAAGLPAPAAAGPSDILIKVQVLLDRAHMSPGVIDGRTGENLANAVGAFEKTHGLSADGVVNPEVLALLTKTDSAPVTQDYHITPQDEVGPFIGKTPRTFVELAKLKVTGYVDPVQELAARFHMSEALLRELNPGADFTTAGTRLLVARPGSGSLPAPVARVEVDKAANQVRALDAGGKILAVYPATVGSTERPAPSGEWAVKVVVAHPDYTYDPKRLTFGRKGQGVLTIAPGPNNPVGSTWIALTKPTYGIHGAPDPNEVGKTASHGCVRLTNWDAAALGKALKKGVPVVFLGQTAKS